jgi:hypothetical protein
MLGLTNAELQMILYAIGCVRLVHRPDGLIAYYVDQDGQERFLICTP